MMLSSPFNQVGANRLITNSLLKGNKFSFNGVITNLEKTVSTINQIVPLYNQVKPLISNSKTIFNVFKSIRKTPEKNNRNNNVDANIINVDLQEPITNNIKKEASNDEYIFTNIDTPNKPFFN